MGETRNMFVLPRIKHFMFVV